MPGILTEVKTLLSTQLTFSPRLLAPIKNGWELFRRCRLISTFGRKKNMQVLEHDKTSRLIGSGPIRPPVRPSKGQSSVLQAIDHSVAGSMTAQPPGSRPSVLRVAAHGQQVAPLWGGGLNPLRRCSRRILQPQQGDHEAWNAIDIHRTCYAFKRRYITKLIISVKVVNRFHLWIFFFNRNILHTNPPLFFFVETKKKKESTTGLTSL